MAKKINLRLSFHIYANQIIRILLCILSHAIVTVVLVGQLALTKYAAQDIFY